MYITDAAHTIGYIQKTRVTKPAPDFWSPIRAE